MGLAELIRQLLYNIIIYMVTYRILNFRYIFLSYQNIVFRLPKIKNKLHKLMKPPYYIL